jgi:hypothetical protein
MKLSLKKFKKGWRNNGGILRKSKHKDMKQSWGKQSSNTNPIFHSCSRIKTRRDFSKKWIMKKKGLDRGLSKHLKKYCRMNSENMRDSRNTKLQSLEQSMRKTTILNLWSISKKKHSNFKRDKVAINRILKNQVVSKKRRKRKGKKYSPS